MESAGPFFAPGQRLSQAHPAYEHRPGQQSMAEAVGEVLERGGRLMVEAGTGTGKTLAYLVPAVLSGRRVVISTGTRNLQDQIQHHELPFLAAQLGLRFSSCVMKGRENYLCRYRLGEFAREPLLRDPAEGDWVARLVEWGEHTASGDRAEVADLPDRLALWRDVNARADTCLGSRCPEYDACWLTRVKRRAQDAQVIVVNHHLFFADLAVRSAFGAVLPDYDAVVFDEAHLLEEVATLYFGVQASSGQLEELARDVERRAARAGGPARGGGGAAMLREAAVEFFAPLRDGLRDRPGRRRFPPSDRGGLDLEAEWAVLSEALDEVRRQAAGIGGEDGEQLYARVDGLRDAFDRVLQRDDPAFVYGVEQRGRNHVTLSAAPIDVSEALERRVFDPLHACVLTSATLAVEGRFDFFRARLGLAEAQTHVVESSFDHARQAVLYLPRKFPEPRDPDFIPRALDEISGLLGITDGRAFLLFTSFANLERVYEGLERIGGFQLFRQGQGSKVALVEAFKSTPRGVLLGTTSFWHGVDVPGDALSLVVVDKLPYAVPGDPLVAARIERIREEGGNPFMEYQTPLAVLELKQGLGRLLRSRSDRGILAVLDPRLVSRHYGKAFLDSLPPYPVVRDLDACAQFFLGPTGADDPPS